MEVVVVPKNPNQNVIAAEEKIANLLAMLLVKDLKQSDAIMKLSRSGFSDDEVAKLLVTSTGNIAQTRYMATKVKAKKAKKAKTKAEASA